MDSESCETLSKEQILKLRQNHMSVGSNDANSLNL